MAATACALLALLRDGDHVLVSSTVRPETRRFFERALPSLGVQVGFVDPRETRGWRRGLSKTTRALFVETPVLTTSRLVDLKPPRAVAQELGLALVVDASAASPMVFRPLDHGADVVVHDGCVLLAGDTGGEVGVVCGSESLMDEVRSMRALWGATPHPAAVAALASGLGTLDVRIERQQANARALAGWAAGHPAVRAVHWPGLASHPDHGLASDVQAGFGTTVVLELSDEDTARRATVSGEPSGETGPFDSRLLPGDQPAQLRVQVGVETADAAVAWLAARLP